MKRVAQKGFTLLEITIALAILTISVAILIDSQGSVAWMLSDTNNVRIATLLAEEKMTEAQLFLEEEGWKDSERLPQVRSRRCDQRH